MRRQLLRITLCTQYVLALDATFRSVRSYRTKESSWDLGTDDRLASGLYHALDETETAAGEVDGARQGQEGEESTSSSWRDQASRKCCIALRVSVQRMDMNS